MTGKRSRARAHDDDEEDDQQSEASDDASAESASPGPSKRARNRGVNGHSIGDEAEEMTTNGYQQEDDDDPSLRRRPGRGRPRAKGQAEEDGWKPGAIRRVKLENFITYEHAEFFPGPSLNMVLGPNGTGKSSLVCAICLGLGYKSEVLGRASAYGEFVKHGKDKATVEIELQKRPGDRTNSVVTLRINREDNSRKFSINGKETTHKEVQALNRSMRIQIDNLCQFLPQDKVAEFAGLSPVELLSKTLQAAAPPEMAEWQDELKNLYGHQKEFQARLKEDDAQLTRLENRQQSLQGDVERIRETQRISAEIERLKTILIAVEYREAKDHFSAIRDQLKELQSQYRSLKGRYAPALEGVNAKEKYMRQIQTVVDVRQRNLKGAEDEAEAVLLKNEAVASSIQNIRIKMEGNENILNAKKKEIGDVKKKITDLQAKYKSKPADFNAAHWNTQIREQEHQGREITAEIREIKEEGQRLAMKYDDKRRDCGNLQAKLDSLDSEDGRLRRQLEHNFPDVARALDWLEKNQDKFEKEVFGPPMLSCSVKDDRYRDLVQAPLQKGDFVCFVTQTANDHKTLSHYLFHELKLSVSVRTSLSQYSEFRNPLSREELQRLGLDGFATDYIEGPEPVLAMFCGEKRLHTTAVGLRDISDEAHLLRLQQIQAIGQFAAGGKLYRTSRRAEYNRINTTIREIRPGLFWRDQPVDTAEKAELQQAIDKAKSECEELRQAVGEKKVKLRDLKERGEGIDQKLDELRRQKGELQTAYNRWQALPDKIETLKNSLAQKVQDIQLLKQQRLSLARDLDKRILEQAKAALAHKEAVADIRAAYQAVLEAQIRLIEAKSDYESLQAEHSEMKEQLGKLEAEVSAMNRTKDAARAVAVKCKDRVALLTDQGVWNEGISEEMEGKSSESVKADIRTQETRLGVIEALNPHALVEYERRAEQIDKLKRERAAREAEAGTLTAEIKEIRDKFEPGLDDIVGRISQAFSHNFERINCAGEVDVYKDEEDFARWAIEIKVRFREGETLQILDQHRQSGGERAVSTIFYLMSLQAMAQAPFRVVDEINQGMDPRNERKVHERMVDIACREHTSQYFLITPKLLTDLAYDKRMTVHVIASGEHVPSYDDRKKEGVDVLDFKKCVQIKRELAARMAYPSPEPVR